MEEGLEASKKEGRDAPSVHGREIPVAWMEMG